jgi:hypothetical protein
VDFAIVLADRIRFGGGIQKVISVAGFSLKDRQGELAVGVASHGGGYAREGIVVVIIIVVIVIIIQGTVCLFKVVGVIVRQNMTIGIGRCGRFLGIIIAVVVVPIVVVVVVVVIVKVLMRVLAHGIQQGIGSSVGKETVNIGTPAAFRHGKGETIFSNAVETVGDVGAEALRPSLVPILISITVFSIIVVIIDGAFGPTIIRVVV